MYFYVRVVIQLEREGRVGWKGEGYVCHMRDGVLLLPLLVCPAREVLVGDSKEGEGGAGKTGGADG